MFGPPKQFGATSPFGAQAQPSFGKPANSFGQQSTFGQQPSLFGSPQQSTGMFGATAATPAFGATATPAFGAPAAAAPQTGFGKIYIGHFFL